MQPGEAGVQIFPSPTTPEGSAADKRAKPPRIEERTSSADAATTSSWSITCSGEYF